MMPWVLMAWVHLKQSAYDVLMKCIEKVLFFFEWLGVI